MLCNEIWKQKTLPNIEDVFTSRENCYEAHQDRLIADLEKLTTKQQDLLKTFATNPSSEPTSQSFTGIAKMPASSINQTIKLLFDKDMIYRVKNTDEAVPQLVLNQIRVLDPLLAYVLKKYS